MDPGNVNAQYLKGNTFNTQKICEKKEFQRKMVTSY